MRSLSKLTENKSFCASLSEKINRQDPKDTKSRKC